MHIRHTIATCTCLPDTWGIRVQTPPLQMACNFADTQWRRSGYKLCIMCPEGEEPARRWRASLSGITLGALQWTMSHPPQLRRSPWQVLLLINRETHLPHLGVPQTCAVAACLSVHVWARTLNDKEATPLSEYSHACIHSSLLQRFRVRFIAFSGNNV